jgi:hypothetical protein
LGNIAIPDQRLLLFQKSCSLGIAIAVHPAPSLFQSVPHGAILELLGAFAGVSLSLEER